ncbi:MAG: right-handed parallel beta-helix repeat-containing protein [Thermoplasmata archaeon]|nr:MAG: right-handed parallel beta-helix repeat-containing protein [Thermoplasmata archaeon]
MSKYTIIIFILALYVLCIGVFASPPPDIEGQTNYGTEWTIAGAEYRGNQTIILDGNLTIESGGSLILYNVTLMMNNTNNDGQYNIEVKNGGTLIIINGSNITDSLNDIDDNSASDHEFMFWVREGANFTMRDSELHECGFDLLNHGLTIEADGVEIKNSILSDNLYALRLESSNSSNILGNNASNNEYGINLIYSYDNNVIGNNVTSNIDCGILLDNSNGNNVTGNIASNNSHSIYLYCSEGNNIIGNIASNSRKYGIYLNNSNENNITNNNVLKNINGIVLNDSHGNYITSNNVSLNGNIGIYLPHSSGNNIISNDALNNNYGILLHYSDMNNITGNNLSSNNEGGITLYYTSGNNITNNTASNNRDGIHIYRSFRNKISGNALLTNMRYGISLESSGGINIINNNISNNIDGILFIFSDNNNITGNDVHWNNGHGIHLASSNRNNITGNNLSNNDNGVNLYSSSWNNIAGNNASSNINSGINLDLSSRNNITLNNASSNINGIYLYESNKNNITDNYATNNEWGLSISSSNGNNITGNNHSSNNAGGITLIQSSQGNKITGNTVTLNTLVGISVEYSNGNNVTDNQASSNFGIGIYIYYSNGTKIRANIVSNNGNGIVVGESYGNNITDNNASSNNFFGIRIYSSDENNITNNTAMLNGGSGIKLQSSTKNNITNNLVYDNDLGISLSNSKENTVAENDLLRNFWENIAISSSSDNNNVFNNTISTSNKGIYIYQSSYNNITSNNILNNGWGIHLESSSKNNITGNNVTSNVISGIYLESSDDNRISNNNGTNNDYAFYIESSHMNNIENNYASGNLFGLYLDSSDWNNITNNTMYLNTIMGTYLGNSDWNNITGNLFSENDDIGIRLWSSTGNTLQENTASDQLDTGISLMDSNGNNIINNLLFKNVKGINLRDSMGNNITSNSLLNNYYGIRLRTSRGNNITNNNVFSVNDYGIMLSSSHRNNIKGNNASNNHYCIYLDSSNGNNIIENNVSNNQWSYGVYLDSSSGNNLTANTFLINGYGVFLSMSSNNIIENCNISSSYFYGVQAEANSHNNLIVNSSFSNSRLNNIYLDDNSSITAINTTFNESKIYFDDTKSTLTVKWFMHVYVRSTDDLPISNVTVFVSNITNDQVEGSPFTTGVDGYVGWIIVTERVQNSTTNVSHTPNNVSVTLNGINGYAEPDPVMNLSKVIIIILDTEKPVPDAGMDTSVDEDEQYIFDGSGSIDNVGILNLTWNFGEGVLGYGMSPAYTFTSSGVYVVVLNVTDTSGNWNTDTVNVFVNNVHPTANAGSDVVGIEGEQINFDGGNSVDSDSDIDLLIYTWDFGDGAGGSGKVINHTYEDNGIYTVTLRVTDDDGATSLDSIIATVNNAEPIIEPVPPQFLQEDQAYSLLVIASDVNEDTITFSDNTTLFEINSVTGLISFTPTNSDVGMHLVNITALDDDGAESYMEILVNILNTNDAPIIISSPIPTATENSTYFYNISAMDDDMDTFTYTLELNPAGMSIDANGKILWIPTNQQTSQTFLVTVNVSDGTDSDIQTFSIVVKNINDIPTIISTPILNATEDIQYNYNVEGIDVDFGDWLTYDLTTAPLGMSIDSSSGLINWVPTNEQVGDHDVIVNLTDSQGAFVIQEYIIHVINSNDAPVLEPIGPMVAYEDQLFYYNVVAYDSDSSDTLSFYEDSDLFQIEEDTGIISFTPSNENVGLYTIKITVLDFMGASHNETLILTVINTNDPPILDPIGDMQLNEDSAFSLTVTASDMDLVDYIIFLDNTTLFDINPSNGAIAFTPTNEDVGVYNVNISAVDQNGGFDHQDVTFIIENTNDPPMIEPMGAMVLEVGKSFSYEVTAQDPDSGDSLTFSDDTWLFNIDPSTGKISLTPSDDSAGLHYVTVTVTDENGESDQITFSFNILGEEEEEPFDFTWILLLVIVGLLAFILGYMMNRKMAKGLLEEKEEQKEDIEPEEIEMELLDEEPNEEDEGEEIEKEFPPPPPQEEKDLEKEIVKPPSVDEDFFEFEAIDEDGERDLDESTDFEEKGQSKNGENTESKVEEDLKEEYTSEDKNSEESEE